MSEKKNQTKKNHTLSSSRLTSAVVDVSGFVRLVCDAWCLVGSEVSARCAPPAAAAASVFELLYQ